MPLNSMELQIAPRHGEGKASKMSRVGGNVTQLKSVSLHRPVGVVGN